MRLVRWLVVGSLLLAATVALRAAPATPPAMPDPCIKAPNLPFCEQ